MQYEVFINIETEEDLYDLRVAGQISERSFNALLLLHQARVDINRADRDRLYLLPNLSYGDVDRVLAYRREVGAIAGLGDLVAAGVLEPQLIEPLRAFVVVRPLDAPKSETHGFARLQARWSGRSDRLPPPAAAQARVKTLRHLDIGVVGVLTRNGIRRVQWDPVRQGLSAEPERTRFELPKLYAEWEDETWEVVAGTYRIGFGQRLTFDVTDQITPNGFFGDSELRRESALTLRCKRSPGELLHSPCPGGRVARVTPDYKWTNRLAGAAVGLKKVSIRQGWLQAYAWGSYQVHRLPQIEVVNAAVCDDPRDDDDPDCRAPPVYVRGSDPAAPASTFAFTTLPAVVAEGLGGANVSFFWHDRGHVGVTGYGSVPKWLVRGVGLDFQEFARKPFGGPFGAVGVNAAFGFGLQDFFLELARSFDSQAGGGGGYAAIFRSVTALPTTDIDVSARYYDPTFANPYARPVSAPDELDGLRARDEAGLQIRTTTRLGEKVGLRTFADVWRELSRRSMSAALFARADLRLSSAWAWALWAEYRNRRGQRFVVATRLAYEPSRQFVLAAHYQHEWIDVLLTPSRPRQDIAAILDVTARPIDRLRIRTRARYDYEDIASNHSLAQILWSYLEAALTLRERDTLRLRYDFRVFLDRRESTLTRDPNPEHWLWVEYVFRY